MSGSFAERGLAHIQRGEFQEAIKVCRLGLLSRPTEVEGRVVLAKALAALGRFDEVLAEMRVALELEPSHAGAHRLKAEALLNSGDALQARELLERAAELDPDDPEVEPLLRRAESALGASGKPRARELTASLIDEGFGGETKHYPADLGPAALARLSPGDTSGTIEIDPELDGVEIDDHDDPVVSPYFAGESGVLELNTGDVELVPLSQLAADDELLGRAPAVSVGGGAVDAAEDSADLASRSAEAPTVDYLTPGAPARREELRADLDFDPLDRTAREDPHDLMIEANGSRIEASAPALDELFPEEESSGVSSLDMSQAPVAGAIETPSRGARRVARQPERMAGLPRSRTEDMHIIREGLGMRQDTPSLGRSGRRKRRARAEATASVAGGRPRRPRTPRGRVVAAYAGIALVVISAGVFTGLKVRDLRLDRQVRTAMRGAEKIAAADTYRAYIDASDQYARIVSARRTDETLAARARMEAALAFEFGAHVDAAEETLREMGGNRTKHARAAGVYWALFKYDDAKAQSDIAAMAKRWPDDPDTRYLAGWLALRRGDSPSAIAEFGKALAASPAPRFYVALGIAHSLAGDDRRALGWFDQALSLAPGHPAAAIERARAAARAGGEDLVAAETALRRLIEEGDKPVAAQVLGVAPSQVAWAWLAIAELAVARGSPMEARRNLETSVGVRPAADGRYADALVSLYLGLGDTEKGLAEAQHSLERHPGRAGAQEQLARAALAAGDANMAMGALGSDESVARRPRALALRGRAQLALDRLDAAAADLDAALAIWPDMRDALVARAEVDLSRGDPRGAVARLKPLYDASNGVDETAVVFASALRRSGELERARGVLAKVMTSPQGVRAYLELARLDRAEGKFRSARAAYAKAIEADPGGLDARLEAADVALDVGDAAGAREALAQLVEDAPTSANVLLAAARVETMTGDPARAAELIDRAEALPTARGWAVSRERGRIAASRKDLGKAKSALERAVELAPDDPETRLLLMDTYLAADDEGAANRALTDVLKRFADRPVANLALGRVHYYAERSADALAAFKKARESLASGHAPPRELAEAHYWVGRVYYHDDDTARGREAFERAIELDPSNIDAYFFLGMLEYEHGRLDRAAQAFAAVTRLQANRMPAAWFYLGEVASKQRRRTDARRALEKYLELSPDGEYVEEARVLLSKL